MRCACAVILFMLCTCGGSEAQSAVYASFSATDASVLTPKWEYGATPGFYLDHWKGGWAHAGFDLRVPLLGSGTSKLQSALVGPRLRLDGVPHGFTPYGEVLVGASHVTSIDTRSAIHGNHFQYEFLVGVDRSVSPRVDWRLAEISWGRIMHTGHTPFASTTVSTGLVLRFP